MNELELKIEDYLDGQLSPKETLAFERALVDPEVASAFNAAVYFREFLRNADAVDVPAGLAERLFQALPARIAVDGTGASKEKSVGDGNLVTRWFGRTFRGPALAKAGISHGQHGIKSAFSGVANMRYALGPFASNESAE